MPHRILKPGQNCIGIDKTSSSGILVDGREYYRAFYHAAKRAERHIAISGWQFDSEVTLLRGEDAMKEGGAYPFLAFLDGLCRENKDLRIYILAWDFSLIFMLEREWMQEWVFNWSTNERLQFRFDGRHAAAACQHQKFAVIDGNIAFLGGMDICAGRWDDRIHRAMNPARINPDSGTYGPYHEVQAYLTGPIIRRLTDIFKARWVDSTGAEIDIGPVKTKKEYLPDDAKGLIIAGRKAALSRTLPQTLVPFQEPVREIRELYRGAILASEKLIYIENQYLSSYAVYSALIERLKAKGRPKIEIIIVLPKKPYGFAEEVSIGKTQDWILYSLRKTSEKYSHPLGVYYAEAGEDNNPAPVYIHSKLMIVDDAFLTIGSANTTNRSMGIDSELNVSFEARPFRDSRLTRSLRELRGSLLAEHLGLSGGGVEALSGTKGIVDYLDNIAGEGSLRLRSYPSGPASNDNILKALDELILDPERAPLEENIFEAVRPDIASFIAESITFFRSLFANRKEI